MVMGGRWFVGANHVFTYREMVAEAGYPAFPTPEWATVFGALHAITIVAGTIVTLYFMSSTRGDS